MPVRRSGAAAAVLVAAALALTPVPAAARPADPPAAPAPVEAARAFSLLVGQRDDFVRQTNFVQCVGASMQTMMNIVSPGADRSANTQLRLQELAREWSGPRPDGVERKGASVRGWAAGLSLVGAGPYRLVGATSLQGALRMAAVAMRETGRPVGLLMWRGRHAWVMTGFRATADPRVRGDFTVTGVTVFDPLYPHGSTVWGPSPRPGALLTPKELGRQFVPRRTSRSGSPWARLDRFSGLGGRYVLVLPYIARPPGGFAGRYR